MKINKQEEWWWRWPWRKRMRIIARLDWDNIKRVEPLFFLERKKKGEGEEYIRKNV